MNLSASGLLTTLAVGYVGGCEIQLKDRRRRTYAPLKIALLNLATIVPAGSEGNQGQGALTRSNRVNSW